MSWEIYGRLRRLHDEGRYDETLKGLSEYKDEMSDIWSFASCLEASCHAHTGEWKQSLAILKAADRRGTDNFWVYFQMAELYRNNRMNDDAAATYRRAHEIFGWTESAKNKYFFTHDYFSPNIPDWTMWFEQEITAAPIKCVEIGSWQGGSTTFLLDKIVSKRGGELVCIDTFEGSSEHEAWIGNIGHTISEIFDRNVAASGHSSLCRKLVGDSKIVLRAMSAAEFDFAYIDGAHEAKFVLQDAILMWPLVKIGGYILFDDLQWTCQQDPDQDTMKGVQPFLSVFEKELRVVSKGRQLLLQKI